MTHKSKHDFKIGTHIFHSCELGTGVVCEKTRYTMCDEVPIYFPSEDNIYFFSQDGKCAVGYCRNLTHLQFISSVSIYDELETLLNE